MNKPAFQFYPGDFIMGTSLMTAEEVGGYIRLLCHQWTNGYIPDKEKLIIQLTGVYDKASVSTILEKFEKCTDGNLRNQRLEMVREDQIAFSKKQSENGQKGGRPPKEINPKESQTKAKINPNDNPNNKPKESSSPSPSPSFSISPSGGENANFGTPPKMWWHTADKQKLTEEVYKHSHAYPKDFLIYFIDYYCQDSEQGGIHLNHQSKFSVESKLRSWWSDSKTKERFPKPKTSTIKTI